MTLGVKAHKTMPHLINNALQKLERLQWKRREEKVLAAVQYLYSGVERKIINAIKYSKINQQQQILIKTLMLRMFYYF